MVLLFLICIAATIIGGICGIGGGVVIKPLVDALGIMSVSTVSFLSGLTVLSMAIVNILKSRKSNELDAGKSIYLGIGAAIGGVAGKNLFRWIKAASGADTLVGVIQSSMLAVMVIATLLYVLNKRRIRTKQVESKLVAAVIGFLLGITSSFLGIGGGPMNLVVLYYFFSMGTKQATINSVLVILISQVTSLIVTLVTRSVPPFDVTALIAMVSAGVGGGFISSILHKKISAETTDKLFCGLLIVIVGICVYNIINILH